MNTVKDILPSLEHNELCGIAIQNDDTLETFKIDDVTVDGGSVILHYNRMSTNEVRSMVREIANDLIMENFDDIQSIIKSELSKQISVEVEKSITKLQPVLTKRLLEIKNDK